MRVVGDQCRYGLRPHDGGREGPARKRTGFFANSSGTAKGFCKKCPNKPRLIAHRRAILQGGRTKAAQTYPPELCRESCTAKDLAKKYRTVEEDDGEEFQTAWDDVSGAALDPREATRARGEEIECVRKMKLYDKVPVSDRSCETGKCQTIGRWIDINKGKGDNEKQDCRSRIVAREIYTYKRDDISAAAPPLEALKLIPSTIASGNKGGVLVVNGVSGAYFHAPATRIVYAQLPKEGQLPGGEHVCGRLNSPMHGTRYFAQSWFDLRSRQPLNIGFQQVVASPCTFCNVEKGIRTYVHGGDYVSVGRPENLQWMKRELEKCYAVKIQMLGPSKEHFKEAKISNRIATWDDEHGLNYEAGLRHVEQLKIQSPKSVATPGTREKGRTQENQDQPLDESEATRYRALVARCNYVSPEWPDIAHSAKELAPSMAKPSNGHMTRFKRLGRYFIGRPRLKQWFNWQRSRCRILTYSDQNCHPEKNGGRPPRPRETKSGMHWKLKDLIFRGLLRQGLSKFLLELGRLWRWQRPPEPPTRVPSRRARAP